jgi:tetratricopeptide (TPR) repeat protein
MRSGSRFSGLIGCSWVFLIASSFYSFGQSVQKKNTASTVTGEAQRAVQLAESGHCTEALPLLKKAIRQTSDTNLKKRIGLDGVHCALTHDAPYESLDFLSILSRDFPRDPEVLYTATHAYSDLSMKASQDLAREAPFSFQVHELNAEALEVQQRWDEAAAEYRKILEINPFLPGVHARLGRALLSKAQPSPDDVEQAKKHFQEELEIDPRNATAEFVLGQLAPTQKTTPRRSSTSREQPSWMRTLWRLISDLARRSIHQNNSARQFPLWKHTKRWHQTAPLDIINWQWHMLA